MPVSEVQRKIIDARGKNIIVSASAGSGKTSVLVERLCQLVISDRIPINAILAMTFTEDAAQEMKSRLKRRLEQEDPNDPYIKEQLTLLETASISTIHGFCLNLLQEFYYQIPISYTMSGNIETGMKDEQALEKAYQQASASMDPRDMARLKLYMQAFHKTPADLQKTILKFLEIAKTKPNPDQWMEDVRQSQPLTEDWFLQYFTIRIEALIEIFTEMEDAVGDMEFQKEQKQLEWIDLFAKKADALQLCLDYLKEKQYKKFGNAFITYLETTGKFTPSINKVSFAGPQKASRQFEKEIYEVLFYEKDFKKAASQAQPYIETFIELARKTRNAFQEEKAREEFIDFSDMEQFAYDLLCRSEVQKEIQNRFQAILIDEYQDTNDLQEAIISKAARRDNVFRVGDVKQSIYGFRMARPSLMKDLMNKKDGSIDVMYMDENFRSLSNIIEFNNLFYEQLMNIEGMESQFDDMDKAHPGMEDQKRSNQKPIRFLYTQYGGWVDPETGSGTDVQARSFHRKYRYDLIARDILKKLQEGYSCRDIAILSRASTVHTPLQEALEAYNIPVLSKAKKGFYTNQAIQIVSSALKAIQDPRNDIALMSVLCSPLGRTTQAAVIEASLSRSDNESLYDALRNHNLMHNFNGLMKYKGLPVGELVEKIYNYNDFYYRFTTSQDKTNLDLFLEKAASVQDSMTLEEFNNQISLEEDFNKTSEAIPFGKESDVVKLSTIHASKGLQYKLVYVLCEDSNKDMEASSPIYLDSDLGVSMMALSENGHLKSPTPSYIAFKAKRFMEDQNEKMRLLYVASTRAEEELVFVDSIKSAQAYSHPLNRSVILNNNGFTSWFFHTFQNCKTPLVQFEEVTNIEKRPALAGKSNRYIRFKTYDQPAFPVLSQTASNTKEILNWSPVKLTASANMNRGNIFHAMAEKLSYPYQRDDAVEFAAKKGYTLSEEDLQQFLSLNRNEDYTRWMKLHPRFECPYSVNEDGILVHGYMDLLVEDGNTLHILDFKTDKVFDMETLVSTYFKQLDTYKNAMQKVRPEMDIKVYLYSFYLQEMEQLNFT